MSEVETVVIDVDEVIHDFGDGNGKVSAHKHPKGGGWVADTAQVENECFVGENACVFGNAIVYGNVKIYDNAKVYGNAQLFGNVRISGDAEVYGDSIICDNAIVSGNSKVYGKAKIRNNAQVYDNAIINEEANLTGDVKIYSNSVVSRSVISIRGFDIDINITDNHIGIGEQNFSPDDLMKVENVDDEWKKLLVKIAEFHGCTK